MIDYLNLHNIYPDVQNQPDMSNEVKRDNIPMHAKDYREMGEAIKAGILEGLGIVSPSLEHVRECAGWADGLKAGLAEAYAKDTPSLRQDK